MTTRIARVWDALTLGEREVLVRWLSGHGTNAAVLDAALVKLIAPPGDAQDLLDLLADADVRRVVLQALVDAARTAGENLGGIASETERFTKYEAMEANYKAARGLARVIDKLHDTFPPQEGA